MKEKIIFFTITGLLVAILAAASITLNLAQKTFADSKNCENNDNCWCYETESDLFCFSDKGDCNKRQMSDISGTSGCSKR
ncbi:MAG: hypothetical protein E6L04_08600 [Thaumarchaeota archaeon]|jgi:hypothetical protein|nr:MAG: hypothetical protein E6L04_08600 [Nitrososphaerota archaeon]TLX92755.1 MAG: hypothetical protein E6K97_00720 [Nitrososphaerota archaeon]